VIDRASRLLAQIGERPEPPPRIALDEISAGLLDARFDVVEDDSQLRLRGERAVMQGARTLLGRPTSCVGRDWELGALAGILDECIEEPAARVALVSIPAADITLGELSPLRRISLSWLCADRGALDQARALAIEVRDACRAHHDRLGEARGTWALAEALRRSGDADGAEREIEAARALAMPHDQPGMGATLAAVRLVQGRAADAHAIADDAMARSAAMGGCGLFRGGLVRLVHAEALHATGDHGAARGAIAAARARLRAIAGRIAGPSYRASFLEAVPESARTLSLASDWLGDASPQAGR
jgi:hypothetical protein